MTETYKSMENPLKRLVDESGKNVADVLCPKENCKCVILRKNAAILVERDGAKVELTLTHSNMSFLTQDFI